MRYFPGLIFLLAAAGIYLYNQQTPLAPFNLPFLADLTGASTRVERGQLTWQILAGLGGIFVLVALVFQLAKPSKEELISEKDMPL